MISRNLTLAVVAGLLMGTAGCKTERTQTAPAPPAARPELKTEAELEAEREARIEAGQIVPTESPPIQVAHEQRQPPRPLPRPIQPKPDSIAPDLLMVNDQMLTAAEVIYPIRSEIQTLRASHTPAGFRERLQILLAEITRREIGAMLTYTEAMSNLANEQKDMLEIAVDKEIEQEINHSFGGSRARLEAHVADVGLTFQQYRGLLRREMVVRQYMREKLMPRIQITRAEIQSHYHRHRDEYETPETRELLMMEFPFAKFLPDGLSWDRATRMQQGQARLAALKAAREANAALAERPFGDVAREMGRGLQSDNGGSWGMIGRPLQAPYETASKLIFEYGEGQRSEPVETDTGYYIVQCGEIREAENRSFVDVQEEIRRKLMEERFTRLSAEYVMRLAEDATVSSVELFINAALRQALRLPEATASAE